MSLWRMCRLVGAFLVVCITSSATWAASDQLQAIIDSTTADEACRDAATRTKAVIDRLAVESIEQSIANAAYVDDYYYPGFISQSIGDPFAEIQVVLSNRRFAKLLTGFKQLNCDQQFALLDKYFKVFLAQYKDIVSYATDDMPAYDPPHSLARASEVAGWPPTAHGTREALHSIVLLSGILGQARMWPAVRDAFQYPTCAFDAAAANLSTGNKQFIENNPLFSQDVRAQATFLMARNTADAAAAQVGFNRTAIMSLVADAIQKAKAAQAADTNPVRKEHGHYVTREIEIPDYRAQAIEYDFLHSYQGLDVDLSHGVEKVEFLVSSTGDLYTQLAALAAAQQ